MVTRDQDSELQAAHTQAADLLCEQLLRASGWAVTRKVPSCPGWDLGTLINHVIGGAERYAMLMEGFPTSDVEATRKRDYVNVDMALRQRDLDARVALAFRKCPPELRFPHRAGPVDRVELLRMRLLECLVHGWDIGATLGSPLILTEKLCQIALDECGPTIGRLSDQGFYAAGIVDDAHHPSERLLGIAGRGPGAR